MLAGHSDAIKLLGISTAAGNQTLGWERREGEKERRREGEKGSIRA
jgi:inosine-uridine nucleoside N-ribohydrolase